MLDKLKLTAKLFFPKYQKLILDYKIDMKPRYGYGKPPHQLLYNIVVEEIEVYKSFLHEILKYE